MSEFFKLEEYDNLVNMKSTTKNDIYIYRH